MVKEKAKKINEVLGIDAEDKWGWLVINGKYFESSRENGKHILIEVKDIPERLKLVNEMIPKLKEGIDAEKILREILMGNFDKKGLEKLHKQLFGSKIKYKPKTREGHCADMVVGRTIIPIVS